MNNKNKIKRFLSLTGFTMVEMLVILGILTVISSTLIANIHIGERQIVLFREQAKVISALSKAKSSSVSTFGGAGVPCGFGVYFEAPRTFIIFKDLAVNCQAADRKYSGETEIYESFQLDSGVAFDNLSLSDIVFIPPNPLVVITPLQDQATIIIKIVGGESSATVKINSGGQIST